MIGILIPVHNEEALLDDCLRAAQIAANHPGLHGETVQILVVLDSCSDASAAIAQAHDVQSVQVQARNVGRARGVGARHLLNQGRAGFPVPTPTAAWPRLAGGSTGPGL